MLSSCYSTVARCRVRWLTLPGEGIPVVFIHGLGCAASYDYPRVVCDPHFRRRAAILIDLPGYGYSDKPWEYGYTIITVAQCGHAMAWENPAGLAAALSAFCARHE